MCLVNKSQLHRKTAACFTACWAPLCWRFQLSKPTSWAQHTFLQQVSFEMLVNWHKQNTSTRCAIGAWIVMHGWRQWITGLLVQLDCGIQSNDVTGHGPDSDVWVKDIGKLWLWRAMGKWSVWNEKTQARSLSMMHGFPSALPETAATEWPQTTMLPNTPIGGGIQVHVSSCMGEHNFETHMHPWFLSEEKGNNLHVEGPVTFSALHFYGQSGTILG